MSAVTFPQPMVEASQPLAEYWYVDSSNDACKTHWVGAYAADRLKNGNCYSTKAEAEQRAQWNAQEMARLVIPAWFRALGPDVEQRIGSEWAKFNASELTNWAGAKPENFRAKPKPPADVVVTVNGKEYRWPPTVTEGEPAGVRFKLGFESGIYSHTHSISYGPCVHHTRAGAEQQLAAIKAAAGAES